jgi:HEPN domain-containing protein
MAEHDLREAEHALSETEDPAYEISCFHAQQAAEKYLKALLAASNIPIPNTHDLVRLLQELPAGSRTGFPFEELAHLTPYAVDSRYPGVGIPETREDAQFALNIARKVREITLPLLKKH